MPNLAKHTILVCILSVSDYIFLLSVIIKTWGRECIQQVSSFQELYWNQFCARDLIEVEKNCVQSSKGVKPNWL